MPLVFLLLTALTRINAMPETLSDFDKSLPQEVAGWKKSGPPKLYTPATLSTYIDGGAELYLSYNFRDALSLKYTDAAENEISVDVFDMGSSEDAFGVFAHSRETVDDAFGQGSEYAAGLLTFWKDRYYASILAYPETPAKKDVVFKLGRAVLEAIPRLGALPPVIALLPAENLIPESVKYFHHYIWLNSFHFVSNENVLDIGPDTPAALGKYRHPAGSSVLLLVRYPDEARARTAGAKFRKAVLGGAGDEILSLKDGRWSGLVRRGGLLALAFNAPNASAARDLLARVKE